jgi:cell division protein FtsX
MALGTTEYMLIGAGILLGLLVIFIIVQTIRAYFKGKRDRLRELDEDEYDDDDDDL